MIQLSFGLCLHVFLICFKYKFVIWLIILLLIECYKIFNGWLMTCFFMIEYLSLMHYKIYFIVWWLYEKLDIYIYIYIEREREREMFGHYGVYVQF